MQSSAFPGSTAYPQSSGQSNRTGTKKVLGLVVAAALIAAGAAQSGLFRSSTNQNPKSLAQTTSWNSTSDNWSGYAETTAQTGQRYTQATAEWTVPSVATLSSSNGRVGCAALWTGIGGATSKDLIQLGTDSCSSSSQTGYFAWYEILPASGTEIPSLQIMPGDRVDASLELVGGGTTAGPETATADYQDVVELLHKYDPSFGSNDVIERLRQLLADGESHLTTEPWWPVVSEKLRALFGSSSPTSSGQVWKLSFRVTTPNGSVETWTKTLSYASSLSSVEWITEAPTASSGIEPLPNYGVAHFIGISADAATPGFSPTNQILLGDPNGQASVPSAPAGQADAFNTCYFPTFHVTSCPDPSQTGNS
jgi:hypothetical protein